MLDNPSSISLHSSISRKFANLTKLITYFQDEIADRNFSLSVLRSEFDSKLATLSAETHSQLTPSSITPSLIIPPPSRPPASPHSRRPPHPHATSHISEHFSPSALQRFRASGITSRPSPARGRAHFAGGGWRPLADLDGRTAALREELEVARARAVEDAVVALRGASRTAGTRRGSPALRGAPVQVGVQPKGRGTGKHV
jgi:hypothetical protein